MLINLSLLSHTNLAIPEGKHELMESEDVPMRYGGEYGELIEEYLQGIVENRRFVDNF